MSKLPAQAATPTDPVDALIKSIRIPPRPSLLASLQAELAQPEPAPEAISRIITSDVGMSGALLKLANSALFSGRRKAASVSQAIAYLGMNQVAALMTGLLARQAIAVNAPALAHFWDVSSRRAQAMVVLSRRLRIGEGDVAHTFGLFCDTGIPLLIDRFPDYARTLELAAAEPDRPFTAVEDARHTTNHAAIGCLLARNWGLSSEVAWAILHHHDYAVLEDSATDASVRSLVALAVLSDAAIQKYQGHGTSIEWHKGGARATAYLGLDAAEVDELIEEINDRFHTDH